MNQPLREKATVLQLTGLAQIANGVNSHLCLFVKKGVLSFLQSFQPFESSPTRFHILLSGMFAFNSFWPFVL